MSNIVIGIEGLVGAGKTSICREMLKKIPNSIIFHGGNLYRAIVYAMMKNGSTLEELKKQGKKLDIKEMMDLFNVKIKIENNETIVSIDDEKIDEDVIQSKEASMAVSAVGGKADNSKLFEYARNLIDSYKKTNNVIVSGRALLKIYPNLDYHFFITADLDERVKRKCMQYENEDYDEVKKNIILRDKLQEEAGFYELGKITKEIDVTKCKNVLESTEKVLNNIKLPQEV
jgi:cytidylate kinase